MDSRRDSEKKNCTRLDFAPSVYLYQKRYFFKIGNFDTQFKIAADFDFLLKLISNHSLKYLYLNKFIVEMEQGDYNSNILNILKANYECYLSLKK